MAQGYREKLSPAMAKKHGRIIHVVARRYGQKIEMERGDWPKVVQTNRLQAHVDLMVKYTDADIHDVTAYLVTLK